MTRGDRITLAWLTPLSLMLCIWWATITNPCLPGALGDQWRAIFPKPGAIGPRNDSVSNPFGIVSCDHFPEPADYIVKLVSLVAVMGLVGWLAARRLEERPVFRAGAIALAGAATIISLALFAYLSFWLRLARDLESGERILIIELLNDVLLIVISVALSTAAAGLTLKRRARA